MDILSFVTHTPPYAVLECYTFYPTIPMNEMDTKRVVILGAGEVGYYITRQLEKSQPALALRVIDPDKRRLKGFSQATETVAENLLTTHTAVDALIEDADVVVSAVPGRIGNQVARILLEKGKTLVDVAFSEQDYHYLNQLAQKHSAVLISDCGVAPGLSNLFVGHSVNRSKDQLPHDIEIMVGGLPKIRRKPYEYVASFHIEDIIAEYTRPARIIEKGERVTRAALSDMTHHEFESIGTLEAFLTDGLRSLLDTVRVNPHYGRMVEKTLRYPGHAEKMALLRDTGFFSSREVVEGVPSEYDVAVHPMHVTVPLLEKAWAKQWNEQEFVIMRVVVTGSGYSDTYDLYCETSFSSEGYSPMAVTTGFAPVFVTQFLCQGNLDLEPGNWPLERLADKLYVPMVHAIQHNEASPYGENKIHLRTYSVASENF